MLRHGTARPEPAPGPVSSSIQRIHHDSAYIVVSCPDDEFPRGSLFSAIDVQLGLKDGIWPDGLRIRKVAGKNILTVVCNELINSGGGRCRA